MKRGLKIFVFAMAMICLSSLLLTSCKEKEEHEHEWGEWSISAKSTCLSQGTRQRICLECSNIQTDKLDIAEHDYDIDNIVWTWNGHESATASLVCLTDSTHKKQATATITPEITKAASCTEPGEKTYTATVTIDGVTYSNTKIEALSAPGHMAVDDAAVAPTCLSTGLSAGKHCSVCSDVIIEQQVIPSIAHDYDTDNIVWVWTEYSYAVATLTCLSGHTHTRDIFANITTEVTTPVTCSANGVITYTATINIDGKAYTDTATETVISNGHVPVTDLAVEATCSREGLTEGSHCDRCQTVLVEQTPIYKKAHTEETLISVPATCTSTGLTEGKRCSVCEEITVEQQIIDKTGHTESIVNAVAATCSSTGLTEGKVCLVCDSILEHQQITAKLPHTEVNIPAVAATCYMNGLTEGKKCSVCNEVLLEQNETASISCNYVPVVTPATCEESGYTTHTCSMCLYSYVNDYVSALEHSYGEWESEDGITYRNCINGCGKSHRIASISATYNGTNLFVGESVNKNDVSVTALLNNGDTIEINGFTLNNAELTAVGTQNVSVVFNSLTASISISVILSNPDGANPASDFSYYEENGYIIIEGYHGASKSVIIPSHIDRIPVKVISNYAFYGSDIYSVVIPDSVKRINPYAFSCCNYLYEVDLGNGLEIIDTCAFENCDGLLNIEIPSSVLALENGAFVSCSILESVTLNEGLKTIGCGAFKETNIKSITIPDSVVSINGDFEDGAFQNCQQLSTVNIGNGVVAINAYTFYGSANIETVILGEKVAIIGSCAFVDCDSLETINLGNNIKAIENNAFENCDILSSIEIPASVRTIGNYAFLNCPLLESVTLNEGLKTIGCAAFKKSGIKSITIPNTVTTVSGGYSEGAFQECYYLTSVTIGDGLSDISEFTFVDCDMLATVTFGKSVTSIGTDAFNNCDTLTEIEIPGTVKSIGAGAFQDCILLESLTLNEGLKTIGDAAFANCSISTLTIPDSVVYIYNDYHGGAFQSCKNLTTVIIGDGLKTISDSTFYDCTELKNVTLGSGIATICDYAFAHCYALKEIEIPDTVTVYDNAFYYSDTIIK